MAKKKQKSKASWDLFDIVEIFVLCTAAIVLIFSLCVRMTIVDGQSMEDTLLDGQYLLVRDVFYTPHRGDIVVVNDPTNSGVYAKPLVKRVIAIEGDTVEIKNGVLYLNGDPVENEEYLKEDMYISTNYDLRKIGENEVFVMGDNRNASGDSRIFGPIDVRCIVGKAFLRVYPFNAIKYLGN